MRLQLIDRMGSRAKYDIPGNVVRPGPNIKVLILVKVQLGASSLSEENDSRVDIGGLLVVCLVFNDDTMEGQGVVDIEDAFLKTGGN